MMLMGRLHEAAVKFEFYASYIGAESFLSEVAKLEQYYSVFLSEVAWKSYQTAAEKVCSQLEGIPYNARNHGIHGDLHSGNIIILEDEPYPIDLFEVVDPVKIH